MKTLEQFNELTNAIEYKKRDDGTDFYCRKDGLTSEIENGLRDVVFAIDENCHNLDLSYEIVNDALNALSEVEYTDLAEYDPSETDGEFASVYTQTRLEYMNIWNEGEITEIVKDTGFDIQSACAYWYDERVREAIDLLLAFIKNEDEE